jgi:hypothetical protein
MRTETLDAALTWEGDHLSEVALTVLADGQDAMLTTDALVHASSCEACALKLGELAELSIGLGEAMHELPREALLAPQPISVRAVAPAPRWAISVALVLAVVGVLPRVANLPAHAAGLASLLSRDVPVVFRGALHLARSTSADVQRTVLMVSLASAFVLIATALVVGRRAFRHAELQGA